MLYSAEIQAENVDQIYSKSISNLEQIVISFFVPLSSRLTSHLIAWKKRHLAALPGGSWEVLLIINAFIFLFQKCCHIFFWTEKNISMTIILLNAYRYIESVKWFDNRLKQNNSYFEDVGHFIEFDQLFASNDHWYCHSNVHFHTPWSQQSHCACLQSFFYQKERTKFSNRILNSSLLFVHCSDISSIWIIEWPLRMTCFI